ncbi:MAG: type II toxin-antitoxin system HicA family toxin [Nitrospira sp. LK70]|nr:type II toxin-antitoxin system HicA family toxin [Nitrospira sp. LK70]
MKRSTLLKHLRKHGCFLKREGSAHALWCNPTTGAVEAVPRHTEISNQLCSKICRNLSLPNVGSENP